MDLALTYKGWYAIKATKPNQTKPSSPQKEHKMSTGVLNLQPFLYYSPINWLFFQYYQIIELVVGKDV